MPASRSTTRASLTCARYGIAPLSVFGSVARGTATPDSVIDVLYELEPGRPLGWEIEQLADERAAVFGRRVDLVSPAALHRRLKDTGSVRGTDALCGVSSSCSKR